MSGLKEQLQNQIERYLNEKQTVFFVQVGSNDGCHGDPIHDFIANENWTGIFIEPVKFLFNQLRQNYGESERFIFENVAIGTTREMKEFYYVSEEAQSSLGNLPWWWNQLGSFNREHIINHQGSLGLRREQLETYIVSEMIECVSLPEVLLRNKVEGIDVLHIDTEGYDYKILSQLSLDRYTPCIILYEHKHLSPDEKQNAAQLLKSKKYDLTEYDDGDTLATFNG